MRSRNEKVFVGMSGGVDSSVAAYLLKENGYDVTGIHLKCWNRNGCDEEEARDARLVAKKLDIPFYVLDMEEEYEKRVVNYMVDSYRRGLTPNPDVMCNHTIKFGVFMKKALDMGAGYVATGHYAKVVKEDGRHCLYAGSDKNKDQSYFLWKIDPERLGRILFPLGDLTKKEVRKIAKDADLHVVDKKDSQGICFVGTVTLRDFLGEYLERREGDILNTEGKRVGTHGGAHFYTIGQRHGLGVALSTPHYVAKTDVKTNTVTLVKGDDVLLESREVRLADVSINTGVPADVLVRIRYRQPLFGARLNQKEGDYKLVFKSPVKFVAPGQSAVFYNSEGKLLGGGVIQQ